MTRSQAATQLSAYFVHQLAEDPGFDRGLLQAVDVLLGDDAPEWPKKVVTHQYTEGYYENESGGRSHFIDELTDGAETRALFPPSPSPALAPPPVEQAYKLDIAVCRSIRERAAALQQELAHLDASLRAEGYAPLSPSPALAQSEFVRGWNAAVRAIEIGEGAPYLAEDDDAPALASPALAGREQIAAMLDEMKAAADPSVTLQKVTFNQLVLWMDALAALIAVDPHTEGPK